MFNSRIKFLKTGKEKAVVLLKRFVDYLIKELIVKKEEHKKIIENMGLPEDIVFSKLGNYYHKEYRKYRYIFSLEGSIKHKPINIPYPCTLFSDYKFQNTRKKVLVAIEFFKQMHVD